MSLFISFDVFIVSCRRHYTAVFYIYCHQHALFRPRHWKCFKVFNTLRKNESTVMISNLCLVFTVLLKTGFLPSYCQILTDLDKILHTPIVVRNTLLWADLDRDRRVGSSRPNQNDYVFVILVTHSKSYIEKTDLRDFGGKPSEWRWWWVLSWKIPELGFCSVGAAEPHPKTAFLRF